jgi:CubicO group peptidase (beta-lactamase class C family)
MKDCPSAQIRCTPLLAFALAAVLLGGCQVFGPGAGEVAEPDYWPTDGWKTASPESYGFRSDALADGLRAMREDGVPVHSLMAIRDGYVLLDATFHPYDRSTVHDLASVTKSVMATLIGIAADQGKLSLDAPMLSFFPDRTIANLDERKERVTVRDLLTMTSGLACDPESDVADLEAMWASDDWVQFSLDRPMVAEPGTKFTYCGPSIHLLSPILQQATGMTALEFGREYLFGPLGIDELAWEADPQGYTRGWGDLALFPQDAAKLGLLMLQSGRWDGRQILSESWVRDATTVHTDTNRGQRYGYAWWLPETDDETAYFSADGRGGQFVTVVPEMNLVIATTGGGFEDRDDVFAHLADAIGDLEKPLPANPDGEASLEAAIGEVATGPAPKPIPELPETAGRIDGRTYAIESNPLGLEWAQLDFVDSREAVLHIQLSGETEARTIPVGLDGTLHTAVLRSGFVGGASGAWTDDETFAIEYDEVARIDKWSMRFTFRDDKVSIQFWGEMMPGMYEMEGRRSKVPAVKRAHGCGPSSWAAAVGLIPAEPLAEVPGRGSAVRRQVGQRLAAFVIHQHVEVMARAVGGDVDHPQGAGDPVVRRQPLRQAAGAVVEEAPVELRTLDVEADGERVNLRLGQIVEEVRPERRLGRRTDLAAGQLHQRAGMADVGVAHVHPQVRVLRAPPAGADADERLGRQPGVESADRPSDLGAGRSRQSEERLRLNKHDVPDP